MINIEETLGPSLRRARNNIKLKQHQLAKIIGCSRMTISEFETGKRVPPLDTFLALMLALKIKSIDDFIGYRVGANKKRVGEMEPEEMEMLVKKASGIEVDNESPRGRLLVLIEGFDDSSILELIHLAQRFIIGTEESKASND